MHTDNTISTLLTIAGSDNTGGAGIQADVKTCCAFKVYAATVITAVTAQNSKGVKDIIKVSPDMILAQLETVFEVMRPDAVKIGMLPDAETVRTVAGYLSHKDVPAIVVDPVLVSTSGASLTGDTKETLAEMKRSLFPISTVITPNIPEAEAIAGRQIDDMEYLCKLMHNITGAKAVLLKGGHSGNDYCTDFLFDGNKLWKYKQYRIETENTHGTGCVLSTSIACGLSKGFSIDKAVRMAKDFVSYAIFEGGNQKVMEGPGPLYLFG